MLETNNHHLRWLSLAMLSIVFLSLFGFQKYNNTKFAEVEKSQNQQQDQITNQLDEVKRQISQVKINDSSATGDVKIIDDETSQSAKLDAGEQADAAAGGGVGWTGRS